MSATSKRLTALWDKAQAFDKGRIDEYTELMAFYEGQQHLLTKYKTAKPWVVNINSPYATYAIDNRVSSLMANDYIGELEPLSPEDIENIQKLNDLYQNEWKEVNMDNVINESILRCAVVREAYAHVVYDSKKITGGTKRLNDGKLEAYFLEPGSMFIDPSALQFRDADFLIVTERMTPNAVKSMYPKYKMEENLAASGDAPEDRGEIYLGNDYDTEQDNVLTKKIFYEKKGDVIKKTIMVETQVVVSTKKMPISIYPIAQLRWEKKMKSPYGISLMDRLLPLQKSINSIESAITNTALSHAAPSFVVRKDSGIDPKAVATVAGAPGVVFAVNGDPSTAITPLHKNSLDSQMIEIKRENEQTIYKLAAVSDQFMGDIGSAGNTSGGTDTAVTRAKIIEQKFLENLEVFVEDLTHILVEYITKAYEGETRYSRGEKQSDNSFNFQEFEVGKDLKDMEYTFAINLDVKTKFSKEKEKKLLMELFQFERQYDAPIKTVTVQDILKTFDVSNRQEFVTRYETLANRDSEKKSAIINQFTAMAHEYQIDPKMVTAGINEIIAGKETKIVEQVMQQVEQQMQQQAQEQQQAEAAVAARGQGGQPQSEAEQIIAQSGVQQGAQPQAEAQAAPQSEAEQIIAQSGVGQV